MTAPATRVIATSRGSRKAVSMRSLSARPTITAGTVVAASSHASRRSVAPERAVAEGGEARRDQPDPVRAEVDEQRDQRRRRGASR